VEMSKQVKDILHTYGMGVLAEWTISSTSESHGTPLSGHEMHVQHHPQLHMSSCLLLATVPHVCLLGP
jgi:hypothetical protein